ncbi:hypothetical protein [Streptomyces sp. NPDC001714]|uniref:hypothetical protein n=1 Tax=Streptomyces sp. NPDC001714 TaxID=3364603 RepID=UPI0036882B75
MTSRASGGALPLSVLWANRISLAPWAGLAVLAGYAVAGPAAAALVLHRRDA